MFLPKGMKLPHGMNMKQAERAFLAMGECSKLIEKLLKDESLAPAVKSVILDNLEEFPILGTSFEVLN